MNLHPTMVGCPTTYAPRFRSFEYGRSPTKTSPRFIACNQPPENPRWPVRLATVQFSSQLPHEMTARDPNYWSGALAGLSGYWGVARTGRALAHPVAMMSFIFCAARSSPVFGSARPAALVLSSVD